MSITVLIHSIIITHLDWDEVGGCGTRPLDFYTGAGKQREAGGGTGFVNVVNNTRKQRHLGSVYSRHSVYRHSYHTAEGEPFQCLLSKQPWPQASHTQPGSRHTHASGSRPATWKCVPCPPVHVCWAGAHASSSPGVGASGLACRTAASSPAPG